MKKTKVIWIGKRKNSKEKLKVSVKLNWGETHFRLLGLQFSVNLETMPDLNYKIAIENVNSIVSHWKRRSITPIGKVTVIKTLLLPQFNHLFTSILIPEKMLNQLNTIFLKFIWDGKVEKVSRNTLCKEDKAGGLKMVSTYHFEKSLKLSWFKKIISETTSNPPPWFTLLTTYMGNLENLTVLGPEWLDLKLRKMTNPFWNTVFQSWIHFCRKNTPEKVSDVVYSAIWYNNQISKELLFLPKWHKNGIHVVGDVLDKDGEIFTKDHLQKLFNIDLLDFDYYRVKSLIQKFKNKVKFEKPFYFHRPYTPAHILQVKGSRVFYQQYIKDLYKTDPLSQDKWNKSLSVSLSKTHWFNIYQACFHIVTDNYTKWFQYRVLYQILGTRHYLCKVGLSNQRLCRLCNNHNETITHLMVDCLKTNELWLNICNWIKNKLGIELKLGNVEKILGYYIYDRNFTPLNFVLLNTRRYIFWCARKNHNLNFYLLQSFLRNCLFEEETLAKLNNRIAKFKHQWESWRLLFD